MKSANPVLLLIVAFLQQLMENWVLMKKKQGGCWKLKGRQMRSCAVPGFCTDFS
jgi:hypothetical protein